MRTDDPRCRGRCGDPQPGGHHARRARLSPPRGSERQSRPARADLCNRYRPGDSRSGSARYGWGRYHPFDSRLVAYAHHRAVGSQRRCRQGRGPRCGRRRLPCQAVFGRRAASPPARGAAKARCRDRNRRGGGLRKRRSAHRLPRRKRVVRRRGNSSHAHRVQALMPART